MIMNRVLYPALFLLVTVVIAGCNATGVQKDRSTPIFQDVSKPSPPSDTPKEDKKWEWQITEAGEPAPGEVADAPTEIIIPRELTAPEMAPSAPEGKKLDLSMTFHDADVREVMKVLLGELLNLNYVIDKNVRGTITFRMTGKFYKNEMLNIIQAVLNANDLALVKREGVIEVTRLADAKIEPTPLILGKKVEKGGVNIVTQVVPLNYMAPQALLPTLRAFITPAGIVMAPNDSHALVVVDKASNMRRLVGMINAFDVPFFAGKAVKFYDIEYANVTNLSKDLKELAASLGAPQQGPLSQIGFVPLADTNKLLVAVSNPSMLATVDFWIEHMDIRSPGGAQLYIYKLQHKKAETMASVLKDLFSKEGGTGTSVAAPLGTPATTPSPGVQAGPVTVISDAESNSLVIRALPRDYQNIRRIIEVMDATPRQVLIEVLIAEVTLTESLQYGVEYFLRQRGFGVAVDLQPSSITNLMGPGALNPTWPTRNAVLPGGGRAFYLKSDVDFIINLLAKTTNVEVLSTPRILVRHEQEATIQVGQEEPILTQRLQEPSPATEGQFVTSNTIEYRDTGVILTVTPRIGENNMVTLDIDQEVTTIQSEVTAGIDSPRFTTRKVTTSLVVENGRTIVIGGTIDRRVDKIVKRIPGLHRIPILGNLFKSQDIEKKRTELLLVLTPHIVATPEDADRVTRDFEKKLRAIDRLRSAKTTKGGASVQ